MTEPVSDLAAPDPQAVLLQQLGSSDPRLAGILQLLWGQASMSRAAEEEARDRSSARLRHLEAENRQLRAANRVLLRHSEYLAAAVGACPLCWGEDASCSDCGGAGGPGSSLPDRGCFQEFVEPALAAIRLRRTRSLHPAPAQSPPARPPDRTEPATDTGERP
jgi:hypothetical protein